ncbi:MAG: 4-hydroxythreonine-4-phosphate dehydrogenase PdxA [Chloroflexi bacterium]|nr:4-hydroxythreonine-4-phosphate dehydrogenase PdxA [Chloroflexota bacterium]MDA1148047.1 4-hydroxythreonine-4-phosphate dehydrogenase PdxA [Chloroflexota bacterium]
MTDRPLVAITLGDPSGIGPEVVANALAQRATHEHGRLFVIGDAGALERAVALVGSGAAIRTIDSAAAANSDPATIDVLEVPGVSAEFPIGRLSLESARASHAWVERAAGLAISGEVAAMATAPVNKEGWRAAGIADTGHQEVLKRMSGSDHVATMLVSGELRCMHLSTHLSLAAACAYVTREHVLRAIRLTHEHFTRWGFASPRIGVAALNPHASDNGLIGTTEQDEIAPAIADAVALGIDAHGPTPADSIFNQAIDGQYDVVVVMYHDQGHIPIKVHGFEESVSVNLGLPFVRTSVDHGTAFDIAGKNVAQSTSMVEAIVLAERLAVGRSLN